MKTYIIIVSYFVAGYTYIIENSVNAPDSEEARITGYALANVPADAYQVTIDAISV